MRGIANQILVAEYDESKIISQEMKAIEAEPESYGLKPKDLNPNTIYNKAISGLDDILETELQWAFDSIDEQMKLISSRNKYFGYWCVDVQNFGWRKLNAETHVKANTARGLLNKILPKTQCSFKVYRQGLELRIQNFHHDSPTGEEWYYINPMTQAEVKEVFME